MSSLTAFVFEPFMVNQPLLDSLLLEPDSFEFFVAWSDDPNGTGTVDDPFRVSTAAAFDSLMQSFPPSTTVHLGPGEFLTNGHADSVSGGWQPKRGQRIVGSGIEVTTLKLVPGSSANKKYFAIGADDTALLDEFEASEMTINCNLASQTAAVAAGAIKVYGSHIRIRHIRATDFGTRSSSQPGAAIATAGAFPDKPEPFDCVVEDCVVEKPFRNNVRETVCIALVSGEGANDGKAAFHRGCVVRNCLIDCNYSSANEAMLDYLAIVSTGGGQTTAGLLTRAGTEHGLSAGNWFVVTGALEYSQPSTHFNGSFTVSSVPNSYQLEYIFPGTDAVDPTGEIFLGRAPSHRVRIKAITLAGGIATVETYTPHYRVPGQNVVLNRVTGLTPDINGSFTINDLGSTPSSTILRFSYGGSGTPGISSAFIGVSFCGISVGSGLGAIIEGNRVLHATCGLYHDTGAAKDVIIRDNYLHDVLAGVWYKLGQVSGGNLNQQPTRAGSSLTQNGALAVFSTAQPHGFLAGMIVTVSGASPSQYNGTFRIATVPSPTSFTYAMSTDPGTNASGSPVCNGRTAVSLIRSKTLATFTTVAAHGLSFGQAVAVAGATPAAYNGVFALASIPDPTTFMYVMNSDPTSNASGSFAFGALWQVGRLVVEHNVIELVLPIVPGLDPPTGVRLERTASSPAAPVSPYGFNDVVIRGNFVRHVNNASDSAEAPESLALQLANCERLIVEQNAVRLDHSSPLEFRDCGAVKFFNNQAPSGHLLQGYDTGRTQFVNELPTDVDLGAILAT